MTDTKQSRLTATLLCVTPPDEHQEQGIRAFLQKKYGEDVALTIQQDSSLKSGFQLHVGSEVYDWSAKGRMEQFRQQVEQLVAKNTRKDIIPLLRSSIDEFRLLAKSSEVGTVKSIGDGIAVVEGLEHAAYGEILMFDNGIKGMVQDLRRNETGCILFDNADDISAGARLRARARPRVFPWATRSWGVSWMRSDARLTGETRFRRTAIAQWKNPHLASSTVKVLIRRWKQGCCPSTPCFRLAAVSAN